MALSATLAFNPTEEQVTFQKRINADRNRGRHWQNVEKYRQYVQGNHVSPLTTKQKTILRALMSHDFCDNICHQIISEAADRIEFTSYECTAADVKNRLDEWYATSRMDEKQADIAFNTIQDGNLVVSLNWSEELEKVCSYLEPWWNGAWGSYIHYDNEGEKLYWVKEWYEIDPITNVTTYRRIVWFPDRFERWFSQDRTTWTPTTLSDDYDEESGEAIWPIPWVDDNGDPLGIPAVHFVNGYKKIGRYGMSDISGGVLGFQDQLNDLQYSLSAACRLTAFPQYWATGIKPKYKDGTREALPIEVDAGKFHTTENKDAKFGMLQSGDMSQIVSVHSMKLRRVAQMTATPVHLISGGDWPSGEALIRAEFPAIGKANKQIKNLKAGFVEIAVIFAKLETYFGTPIDTGVEKAIILAKFIDPERRDVLSRSIIVHNLVGFISVREGLRIMGYSEEQAQYIYDEIMEEKQDMAEALAKQMAAGLTGAPTGTGASSKEARGGHNGGKTNPKQNTNNQQQ